MKKALFFALTAFILCGCGMSIIEENESPTAKKITFRVNGDFTSPTFTRAALSANGSDMTDLWVFDFVDEECVQSIHLTPEDEDFGAPTLTMAQGSHTVCFVVSRGDGATVDESARTIEWSKVSDTFWADLDMNITQSSPGNVAVTLNRVATRLRLTIEDAVPTGVTSVDITPAKWYYGLNYWTGDAAIQKTNITRTISVPSSYVGTTGHSLSIFGLSNSTEWTTDVSLQAKDGDGAAVSSVSIANAPFKSNRTTQYSGRLFGNDGAFTLSLNDEWDDPYSSTW